MTDDKITMFDILKKKTFAGAVTEFSKIVDDKKYFSDDNIEKFDSRMDFEWIKSDLFNRTGWTFDELFDAKMQRDDPKTTARALELELNQPFDENGNYIGN